jgi:gluconolactonase
MFAMKRRLFLFLGALCSFGYNSCQKNMKDSANDLIDEQSVASTVKQRTLIPASLVNGTLDTIQKGFGFTEGPAVDKFGNVFFTDQPNDKIYRWDAATNKITLFLDGTGRSNGMEFDKDGNLIACADMHGELWSIDKHGNHKVLVNNYNGKLLNGPNDVWINPVNRGMYITDPMFPRGYWDATDPRKTGNPGWPPVYSEQGPGIAGHVYYLAPGSNTLVRVTTMDGWHPESSFPNGVVGTPDGRKLYVNKWAGNNKGGTWVFDINKDGTLSNMKKFTEWGGDGMSMDELGNIYISNGNGVMVFDPQGNNIVTIATGGGATNNVFAALNEKTLFITGPIDRVTKIQMNVKGIERFGGEHLGQIK